MKCPGEGRVPKSKAICPPNVGRCDVCDALVGLDDKGQIKPHEYGEATT